MLVVHVGTPKSGTKALQGYLLRNSEALLDQGVRYIEAGREKRGHRIAHNELARAIKGNADIAMWDRLRDELAESDSRVNVMSAEGFWFCDPALLKKQLPRVKNVRIVVYLRRQDKYLQSLYMQTVSAGKEHSFAEWRENVGDRGNYLETVDAWAEEFGSKSIIVRPYERNGVVDTVADFNAVIGATPLQTVQHLRTNPSPRRELLHFVRALNDLKLNVDQQRLFNELIHKDTAYMRSCDLLTYEESAALLEGYKEENQLLIEKYYHDTSAPLFPELVPFGFSDRWDMDSEQYYRLTVDILDVLTDFILEGQLSKQKPPAPREDVENRPAANGRAKNLGDSRMTNGKGEARNPRRDNRPNRRTNGIEAGE
ncbi:MAG TPA: hypothetical protein VGK90_08425 [Rhizomicrobium sp.]